MEPHDRWPRPVRRVSARGAGAVALALLVGALASRFGSGVRCPAGMMCAAAASTGDEIASMPEPCVGQIADDARRLRAHGFNAMVFPVRTHADTAGEEQVAPSILARKLARATALAHAASITPLVALAGDADGRCDTEADRWFVRAYRAALAVHRRDDATLVDRLYCAEGGMLQRLPGSDPLDAEPTRLSSFLSSSMFVLNDVGNHPLLLLEAGRIPAVYFVPAGGEQ